MEQDQRPSSSRDIFAGLTSATVILPKAMAYASVAGLSLAVGLYTSLIPILVYAFLGTSRVLSVTSTTTLGILTAAEISKFTATGSPLTISDINTSLTVLVGLVLLMAAVFRLGFLANFISTSVLIGFKAGIGLVIVLDQAPKLLGIHFTKQNFFADLQSLVLNIPNTSIPTLTVAVVCFGSFFILTKIFPRLPVSLVVVAGGIFLSWLLNLEEKGISVVGTIPQGLPPFKLPTLSTFAELLPAALGIALMSFTESIAVGRTFYQTNEPPLKANRELIATGASNIIGGLFGSMPSGGGASQTAVLRAAGGTSQKANVVVAIVSLATMLVLAPLLGLMPNTVLAAIVIIYSVSLIQLKEFIEVRNIRTMEFRWAVTACLGVLVFGTLKGIIIAIIVSLVGLASQAVRPRVSVMARKRGTSVLRPLSSQHPDDQLIEGLLILRPEGRVFFLNAQSIADQINSFIAKYKPEVLLLDLSRVPDLEYSALKMLIEGDQRLTSQGGIQWFSAMNPNVLKVVRNSAWIQNLEGRLFFTADLAIQQYLETRKDRTQSSSLAFNHGRDQARSAGL